MRVVADFDFDLDVAKARFSFKPGFLKVQRASGLRISDKLFFENSLGWRRVIGAKVPAIRGPEGGA
jgi:hypothetical protein